MRFWKNKKGESFGSDSSCWVWISSRYPKWILREFRSNYSGILWLSCPLKNWISQQNSGFEKLVLVGETCNFEDWKYLVLADDICKVLRLSLYSRNPQFSQSAGFIYLMYNLRILLWYRSFTLETDVPLFLPTSLLNVRFEAGLSDWKNLTEPNIVHSCNGIHCSVHHILLWVKLPNESPNFKEQWWLSWTLHVATSWSGWLGRGQQA